MYCESQASGSCPTVVGDSQISTPEIDCPGLVEILMDSDIEDTHDWPLSVENDEALLTLGIPLAGLVSVIDRLGDGPAKELFGIESEPSGVRNEPPGVANGLRCSVDQIADAGFSASCIDEGSSFVRILAKAMCI